MTHSVAVSTVDAQPTAVLGARTTWPEYPAVWHRLLDQVHANVTRPPGAPIGLNVMLYLTDEPQVEVGILLLAADSVGDPVQRSALPAGQVARTTHVGDYGQLDRAHAAVHAFCAERGLAMTGVRWEIYGHWSDDPAQVTTEVCYLLA